MPLEKDTRSYTGLPYYSEQASGDGWITVGDAAGFIDPLYSQGLDYCSHAVSFASHIIARDAAGECVRGDLADYAEQFRTSYFRWYEALYKDKYRYLGDAELMDTAFWLDIGTYFIGPVRLVHDDPELEFPRFPYYGPAGKLFADFMAFYNRRLGKNCRKTPCPPAATAAATSIVATSFTKALRPAKRHPADCWPKGIVKWLKLEIQSLFLPVPQAQKKMLHPTNGKSRRKALLRPLRKCPPRYERRRRPARFASQGRRNHSEPASSRLETSRPCASSTTACLAAQPVALYASRL